MAIKVSDAMTRRIIFADPGATARELAAKITECGISSVVILDGGKIAGIVTEHDLSKNVVAADKSPSRVKASEIMSKPVITIDADAEIEEAARLMRDNKIKKLLAVKDGTVQGIISSFDIVAAEPVIRLLLEKGI